MKVRRVLAVVAAALGAMAAFAGPWPVPGQATEVAAAAAVIAPLDLAEWVRDGKAGLCVVDLRATTAFDEGHVPNAESIDVTALTAASLATTDIVVLYAAEEETAVAARSLRSAGHRNVFTLQGGFAAWQREVMFPTLAEGASASERAFFARASILSRYFGGNPRKGATKPERAPPRPRGC